MNARKISRFAPAAAGGRTRSPWASALTALFLACAAAIVALYFTGRFFAFHLGLPEGCDEFGYLNLAKAVAENTVFADHAARPFDPGLLNLLRSSGFPYPSYSHMIAPHAYHLDQKSGRVINQYPPGTGLLLSAFPLPIRKVAFPAVCGVLVFLFLVVAFRSAGGAIGLFEVGAAILILAIANNSFVFKDSLKSVNSIAPTLGMLMASGFLLTRKPRLAAFLLGLSCLFRVANALLVVPVLLFYAWSRGPSRRLASRETVRGSGALLLSFLGGCGLYIIYAGILLGNPLRTTYSYFDLKWNFGAALANLGFYWNWSQPWFKLHIFILLGIALCVLFWKMAAKLLVFSLAAAGVNYAFYVVHDVKLGYYPYASAVLALGVLLSFLAAKAGKSALPRKAVAVAGLLVLGYAGLVSAKAVRHVQTQGVRAGFARQIEAYRSCFSGYDVVWGDFRTGTVEYATSRTGFRYKWGSEEARKTAMLWLSGHGFRQAVWPADMDIPLATVERDVQAMGLKTRLRSCPEFGEILEISEK